MGDICMSHIRTSQICMCGIGMHHIHAGAASWILTFGLSYIVGQ